MQRLIYQGGQTKNLINWGHDTTHMQRTETLALSRLQASIEASTRIKLILLTLSYRSAFELPFKDNYFDLVMTNGVLIHLAPADIGVAMQEIVRVSKNYVMGFEYFSDQPYEQLAYRGNSEKMWKTDFAKQYLQQTSGLNLVEQYHYPYNEDAKLVDHLFLLQKSN